jgi:HD superfamily phosphodiesterase
MWNSAEAKELAASYLDGRSARWRHVSAVAESAGRLVRLGIAPPELEVAAWLHDIGYAQALVHTGMHAIDGAAFLQLLDAPPVVVGLVAFHTGAEFEADERGLMDKLIKFERPDQDLLDLMILADMVSGPDGEQVTVEDRLAGIFARYEPQHPVHRAVTRSSEYLIEASARALNRVGQPI